MAFDTKGHAMKSLLLMLLFLTVQEPKKTELETKIERVLDYTRSSLDVIPDRIKALEKDLAKAKRAKVPIQVKTKNVDKIKAEISEWKSKLSSIESGSELVWPQLNSLTTGEWGQVPSSEDVYVIQVIDKNKFLGRIALTVPEEAIFEGFSTNNIVDKTLVGIPAAEVVGTITYTTAIGGTRTVKHVKAIDMSSVEKPARERWLKELGKEPGPNK
jgi:hypothetical protein